MKSLAAKPRSPLLAACIKSFHYHETDLSFALERIMPNGQCHLMVNLAEDEFRSYDPVQIERAHRQAGAVLAGPHYRSAVLDTREMRWLVAVEFRSGGAGRFSPMPMSEFTNQVVQLGDLWGRDGELVRERLLEAPTPAARFCVLEQILLRQLTSNDDPAIQFAVAALHAGMQVSQVALRLGLLPRTLTRRFAHQVGITPKRFARVRRLQRVLRAARQTAEVDWSALAAHHGFVDQAHLVHEFRALASITPTEYKPHSARRSNHVPIAAH